MVHGTYFKLWELIGSLLSSLIMSSVCDDVDHVLVPLSSRRRVEEDDAKPYSLRRGAGGRRWRDEWLVRSQLYFTSRQLVDLFPTNQGCERIAISTSFSTSLPSSPVRPCHFLSLSHVKPPS